MSRRPSVLITGASSGIGLALALHFERQGFEVFAGVRRPQDAQSLVAQSAGHLVPLILDVTRPDTIEAALARVQAHTQGRLNALINNAGVAGAETVFAGAASAAAFAGAALMFIRGRAIERQHG